VTSCPRDVSGVTSASEQCPQPSTQRARLAPAALTEEQRRYAAEHHDLIYRFLREKGWSVEEYYDVAAFGYLTAVMQYLSNAALRRYAFSTVAWNKMKQSIANHRRAEVRRRESETAYAERSSGLWGDPFEELEYNLLLHDLAVVSDERQYELASMRLQGYSIMEIARKQGMDHRRVSRLLKELYQVYMKLYL